MKSSLWKAVALVAVVSLSFAVVAAASSSGKRRLTITSVKVSGSSSNPTFTIKGRNLKLPKPNPTTSPSNQLLCPVVITGNAGYDYGNSFFVIAWEAQPNDTNTQMYAAGRYRPTLNELDCIGIIVVKHTTTSITFKFGHGYQQFYGSKPRFIKNGDVIEVGLRNARFATVVHF